MSGGVIPRFCDWAREKKVDLFLIGGVVNRTAHCKVFGFSVGHGSAWLRLAWLGLVWWSWLGWLARHSRTD